MNPRAIVFALSIATTGCGDGTAPANTAEAPEIQAALPHFIDTDVRQPCKDQHPETRAFFGALHIHTSLSFDAWVFGNSNGPENAYAYARGEPIFSGPERVRLQIDRPLDFAAVTDHSEQFAQIGICTDPKATDYDHLVCRTIRGEVWWAKLLPDALSARSWATSIP